MRKIRIGNDICLQVNLTGSKNIDAVNINSVNAYFINTSKWEDLMAEQYRESVLTHDEIECRKHKIRFVSRFPVEPYAFGFTPNPYDICCSGRPCYHMHPMPFVPVYPGFGVHPHTFEPHTWCHDDMHDVYCRAGHKHEDIQRDFDRCRFLAPVEGTESKNAVKVLFPANAQIFTGKYKLMLVVKVYEPGYCKNNLRTITLDYSDVFELVNASDMEGEDGNIMINIGNSKTAEGINISGTTHIQVDSNTTLYASVRPSDVIDGNVEWEIVDGSDVIEIVGQSGTYFKIKGLKEGTAVVKATSTLTPSIEKTVTVVVSNDPVTTDGDVYVDNVSMSGNLEHVVFRRTGGKEDITIDTWEEINN